MIRHRLLALVAVTTLASACKASHEDARIDSVRTAEQLKLTNQLAAQKDSLMSVVLEADKFITNIDSQISKVKGLPVPKGKKDTESPIQDQLQARRVLLTKVDALVKRAQTTARQLAESKGRVKQLQGDSARMQDAIENDQKMIAELGATIQRQTARIDGMQVQLDSLATANQRLGADLASLQTVHNKAYYIIGTEDDLLQKGVIVREGGANLLLAHPGRTIQPARQLDANLFTTIDQRNVSEIPMPDTTRQYAIVSRQSLDDASVIQRDKNIFRGNIKIRDAERFWTPSKYLIIVQK